MTVLLLVFVLASDGLVPVAVQPFETLASCEAARAAPVAKIERSLPHGTQYVAVCLPVERVKLKA